MSPRQLTEIIVWCVIVGLGIYDLYMIYRYGPDASVSRALYDIACRFPIVAFALGILVGHVFWPMDGE